MLSILTPTFPQNTPTLTAKRHKSFGSDGHVYYLVVMASQMYAYVQTQQNVYIKCVQFFVY